MKQWFVPLYPIVGKPSRIRAECEERAAVWIRDHRHTVAAYKRRMGGFAACITSTFLPTRHNKLFIHHNLTNRIVYWGVLS